MIFKRLLLPLLLCLPVLLPAQSVAVNTDGSAPDASAILDLKTSTKGLLIPRMLAAEKTAIVSPAKGLLIYQTNGIEGFYYNNGTSETPEWLLLGSGATLSGGTANYLIKWTGPNTVMSSIMRDNGTEMAVNGVPVTGTTLQVYNNSATGIGLKTINLSNGTAFYSQADGTGTAAVINHTGTSGTALSVLSGGAYAATFMGGRIGIGTTTPTATLQLIDTATAIGPVQSLIAAVNGTSVISMGSITNNSLGKIAYDNSINKMGFTVNGNQLATITSLGIGIGQNFSTPQNLVQLFGGSNPAFVQVTNSASGITTTDGMHFGLGSNGDGYISYLEPHDFKIQAGFINSFWMNSSGKIGLYGPPDTTYSLLLYNKTNHPGIGLNSTGVIMGDVTGAGSHNAYISIPFETNSNILLMGGNVGVGITPTQKLDVNGNIQLPASSDYKYASSKTHYYSVPAAAFQQETTGSFNKATSNGSIYAFGGEAAAVGYFSAPIHLPDGASITCVSFYEVDNDTTYDLQTAELFRNDASVLTSHGNTTVCASITSTTGANTDIRAMTTTSISNPLIDNQNYAYYLRWGTQQDNPNLRLAKVLITYTVTKAD